MNYISFIDQFGLDLESLSSIDGDGIIKLLKRLKAKAMLGDASNLGELSNLVDQLKDDDTRQAYVYIEQHPWLKHLISGHHELIEQNEIGIDKSLIVHKDHLKYVLSPFLKTNLKRFLSENLSHGRYVPILKVLTHNYLFSEEINQLVINFFKVRLNYAAVYLRENRLVEKQYPVSFITNKIFINCLNEYPDQFNSEIQELNSEVIDIYNTNRKRVENPEFVFAAKAMVAFSILDTSNYFLKETLKSNASIAREYTYPSRHSRRTSSGFGGWSIVVIVMIVIRVVFWIGKGSSSNDFEYINGGDFQSQPWYSDSFQNALDSLPQNNTTNEQNKNDNLDAKISEKYKLDDHIKFIYTLKRKVDRGSVDEAGEVKILAPFSNPYPATFNTIPQTSSNIESITQVHNLTGKDIIFFRLTKGIDQSLYIPKDASTMLQLTDQDSLLVYAGQKFTATAFSHFIERTDISNLLVFKTRNQAGQKEISIHPFEDVVTKVKSSSSNRVLVDSSRLEVITSKNCTLNPLSIDDLYTDYYNKNYRN
ncbi:hypothetical protein [Psychroserpens sp.]|uniref:hypothetical protein n=1 Tax=Psychroserpens sp. TaxID=2020870 RepID=UPI003C7371F8